MMNSSGNSKHQRSVKYIAIEEKVICKSTSEQDQASASYPSIVKDYQASASYPKHCQTEETAQKLGEKDFRASSGWCERETTLAKVISSMHGEAGEVDREHIKKRIKNC